MKSKELDVTICDNLFDFYSFERDIFSQIVLTFFIRFQLGWIINAAPTY